MARSYSQPAHYRSSRYTDLQQRCYEFEQLRQTQPLMKKVLPYDASCEDITVNTDLSFLNAFVNKKLDEGAKPYEDLADRLARKSEMGGGKARPPSCPTAAARAVGNLAGSARVAFASSPSLWGIQAIAVL
ncbi:unnamed protein product [Prorocentrum cordatum]|uniref:Pre-mRNA-splicing factor 38 n=1 Tax=Prorocentrum cordatum TaxID=2364126 RepID=A0ABN9VWH4_9DINO|nr:unnamed protein product [Polarella glacialis]